MVNPLSQAHGSHAIQCRMHSWNVKEILLASLPSAGLSMVGVFRTDTRKGTSVQQVHFCCSSVKLDHLFVTTKGQGQKGVGYEVPVLWPIHLLVSLLDYTCWIFSLSLLFTCLSVYKHKAKITSTLPFLLSLFFVFIHPHSMSQTHLPYCIDHHTVFLSKSSNVRW